jgi:hypothetical protein
MTTHERKVQLVDVAMAVWGIHFLCCCFSLVRPPHSRQADQHRKADAGSGSREIAQEGYCNAIDDRTKRGSDGHD